jgi:glycerophosphoryl diester phosphodiesterase
MDPMRVPRAAVLVVGVLASRFVAAGTTPGPGLMPAGARVAHALGAVDGVTYTCSLEAFERSVARGFSWLEVDVALTADSIPVCAHQGLEILLSLPRPVSEMTVAQLLSCRLAGRFTPLSLTQLLRLLRAHPHVNVLVDTGGWTAAMLAGVEAAIAAVDPAVRRQLAPEVYWPGEVKLLRAAESARGPFRCLAFASYQSGLSDAELVRLVGTEAIGIVVLPTAAIRRPLVDQLHRSGAQVLVHTVNDDADADRFVSLGVDGVMTDTLPPVPSPVGPAPTGLPVRPE